MFHLKWKCSCLFHIVYIYVHIHITYSIILEFFYKFINITSTLNFTISCYLKCDFLQMLLTVTKLIKATLSHKSDFSCIHHIFFSIFFSFRLLNDGTIAVHFCSQENMLRVIKTFFSTYIYI